MQLNDSLMCYSDRLWLHKHLYQSVMHTSNRISCCHHLKIRVIGWFYFILKIAPSMVHNSEGYSTVHYGTYNIISTFSSIANTIYAI